MNYPVDIDESHPGWNNLTPDEQNRFKQLREKELSGTKLSPEEEAELAAMKEYIKNGRPIDENHPGFDNLNPE